MGIFRKTKDGMEPGHVAHPADGEDATGQAGADRIGVQGMPVNPAALGGPSTAALSTDDPLLQPINGIGIPEYAAVAKEAQARGVTDEAGMNQIASEMGYDPAVFGPAVQEWVRRMGQSMVVGQQFRAALGY
jgi:hypothetical protein